MCNCLSENKAKVAERLAANNEGKAIISNLSAQNVGIVLIDNKMLTQPVLEYEYQRAAIKADSSTARPQKKTVSMMFTFCPFCGVRYQPEA